MDQVTGHDSTAQSHSAVAGVNNAAFKAAVIAALDANFPPKVTSGKAGAFDWLSLFSTLMPILVQIVTEWINNRKKSIPSS